MWPALRSAALDAWAVLAPTECSGCGAPDRGLCDGCRAGLAAASVVRESLGRDDGTRLPLWRAFEYEGEARSILLAFKDGGRTDAAPALAAVLRRLVRAALAEAPGPARGRVELAAIPSTRAAFRRRGYRHVPLLIARAGYRDARLLHATRQTRDQSELGTASRFANRAGSLAARGPGGRFVLLVDDIVTTGATLLEADRALREAGHTVLGAVALARTQRRLPKLGEHGETGRKAP
jgi:predicted amidophosphoribosyltransferase